MKYFWCLVFLMCFCYQARAQEKNDVSISSPEKVFKHLTIDDGLSQNYPLAITQDSRGFLWFGTLNGLNKYDGYSFTVFTNDPYDSTSISGNSRAVIFEDSRGLLWIGTYIEGAVDLMDTRTEKFRKIPPSFPFITCIAEDKESNIWIGTLHTGLFMIRGTDIEKSNFRFTHYEHQPELPASLSNDKIRSIAADNDNNVWVGNDFGMDKLPAGNKKDFEHFSFADTTAKNKYLPGVQKILVNSDSTLWIFTASNLIQFNRYSRHYTSYPRITDTNGFIFAAAGDRDGNLWMSDHGRLVVFNIHNKTYDYLYKYPGFPLRGGVASICSDKAGDIWMGTNAYGIYTYFPESKRFKSFPNEILLRSNDQSIRTIYQDSRKNLWFIGGAVLFNWNMQTGRFKVYDEPPYDNNTGYARGYPLMEDRNGYLWFDNYRGLGRINIKTDEPAPFIPVPRHDRAVSGMLEDHSGVIWVAGNYYLSKLIDIHTGQFISYMYNVDPSLGGTTQMYEDKEGFIWLTSNLGLISFDKESGKFTYFRNNPADKNSLYSNSTLCICPDPAAPDEKLWIGTKGGGLNLFDKKTGTCRHFMTEDGLPDNVVYGVLPDSEGNLWLSTNKGLSKFNPGTKQFINYDVHDGLQSNEFNTGAFFKSRSGEMFFGGINGFNYFYPGQVAGKNSSANVVFTDFKLFSKSVTAKDSGSVLRRVISDTDSITLAYNQNNFSLEFAVLDYYAPSKNRFEYKLEGFSDNWIQLGTRREMTFTGLDPGEYVLKVKGTNSDGIWNKNIAALNILITPPWWLSSWAYGLYFLLIITLLYALRRYELNRQQWKHSLELETIESFRYKELSEMKSRFFANISHEFRTPLSLILGQVDSVMSSDIKVKEKGKLQVANRNARRLLTLINQLLDISKIESGSLELNAESHNIVSFLKSLFYSFESLAEFKKIKLSFYSEFENLPVIFDPDKMEKIFYNLISNAFKFTGGNGHIKVEVAASNESTVEIKIKDTGIGIPADRLPKIFERFYQVDGSQTREHQGTGIGLALAKELIELHKGKISVNSKEGEGSEFIVRLPRGKYDPESELLTDHPNENSLSQIIDYDPENVNAGTSNTKLANVIKRGLNKEIILLVEDNSDVRAYITDQLEKEYNVFAAVNGEDGILNAQREIPDLIITDVMMPKMNGYEFSKKIRSDEKTSHIPIIMLTAKAGFNDKIEGLESGIDAYLIKPFSLKELRVRIRNLIDQRKQLRKQFSQSTIIKPSEVSAVSSDRAFLEKTLGIIEKHFDDENFNVEILARQTNMSMSQLNRKLNALIDQPGGKLINSVRLQRAADLLKNNAGNVTEICFKVGFNDQSYFARAFRKQFGCSPTAYRKSGN